jgi:hypothetical protein
MHTIKMSDAWLATRNTHLIRIHSRKSVCKVNLTLQKMYYICDKQPMVICTRGQSVCIVINGSVLSICILCRTCYQAEATHFSALSRLNRPEYFLSIPQYNIFINICIEIMCEQIVRERMFLLS